jgi:threonine synthase
MDVGNPSNFPRLAVIYQNRHELITSQIKGYSFDDSQNKDAMAEIQKLFSYQSDPHGALAYLGLKEYGFPNGSVGIFLETAHPSKVPDEVEKATKTKIAIPDALSGLVKLKSQSVKIPNSFQHLLTQLYKLQ